MKFKEAIKNMSAEIRFSDERSAKYGWDACKTEILKTINSTYQKDYHSTSYVGDFWVDITEKIYEF